MDAPDPIDVLLQRTVMVQSQSPFRGVLRVPVPYRAKPKCLCTKSFRVAAQEIGYKGQVPIRVSLVETSQGTTRRLEQATSWHDPVSDGFHEDASSIAPIAQATQKSLALESVDEIRHRRSCNAAVSAYLPRTHRA
jgi:hypothetical protein